MNGNGNAVIRPYVETQLRLLTLTFCDAEVVLLFTVVYCH